MVGFMAIDQYGQTVHIGDNSPRKYLLDHCGRKHAKRMFCDTKGGEAKHIGWVIAGRWFRVYQVHELHG